MSSDPIAATRIVATVLAPIGNPAAPRIAGLTTMMYAIARNVVTPPMISVRMDISHALLERAHIVEIALDQRGVRGIREDLRGRMLDQFRHRLRDFFRCLDL